MKDKTERERLLEAIRKRHSVRKYKPEALNPEVRELLQKKIDELNRLGDLHMQLVVDEPRSFKGIFAYGMFSGVRNYVVVAGKKDDTFDERVGYYGEQLVLYAQTLGLNSCWAGLTYRKIGGTYELLPGEKIACYIALGYGETQGSSHKINTPRDVSNVSDETPDWFLRGVEAALLAPTAVNQQKFHFQYVAAPDSEKPGVIARKGFSLVGYAGIDLGIAKYHFEIGAGKDNFVWVSC